MLYLPPVQRFLTNQIEKQITKKIETHFEIGALRLNLNGNLILKDIYIQDQTKDTLLHAGKIGIDISILKLLKKKVEINDIEIRDTRTSLFFDTERNRTNFTFIIDQFSNKEKKKPDNPHRSTWEISLRNINCKNIFLDLKVFEEMEMNVTLGELILKSHYNDLNKFVFDNNQLHVANTTIDLRMHGKNDSGNKSASTGGLDSLIASFRMLSLENIIFRLLQEDRMKLDVNIREFAGKNGSMDLSTRRISTDQLNLRDSKMEIEIFNLPEPVKDSLLTRNDAIWLFDNFAWDISTKEIKLDQLFLTFHNRSIPDTSRLFTFHHLELADLSFLAEGIELNNQNFETKIKTFQFYERKGFLLNKLTANISANPELLAIEDIEIKSEHSYLKGALKTNPAILTNPNSINKESAFLLLIDESFIEQQDLNYFIQGNPMKTYLMGKIDMRITAEGTLDKILLKDFSLQIDESTGISATGFLEHILDTNRISFDLHTIDFFTSINDLRNTIPQIDTLKTYLPGELIAKGNIKGSLKNFEANFDFQTTKGNLGFRGRYFKENAHHIDTIGAEFWIDKYDLANFFFMDSLKNITMSGRFGLSGLQEQNFQAEANLNISSLEFSRSVINDIQLTGSYTSNGAYLRMNSQDPALGIDVVALADNKDSILSFDVSTVISRVDLNYLGITNNPLILSTSMNVNGRFIESEIQGLLKIDSIDIAGSENIEINEILIDFLVGKDSTFIDFKSENISTYFSSNISPGILSEKLKHFILRSVKKSDTLKTESQVRAILEINFKEPLYLLSKVFPDFKIIYLDHIYIDFDESKNFLSAEMTVPAFDYKSVKLDSITTNFLMDEGKINYNIGAERLSVNSLDFSNLTILGNDNDTLISNQIIMRDSLGKERYFIGIDLSTSPERALFVQLNPDRLLIDRNSWDVSESSVIMIDRDNKMNGRIEINRNTQQLLFQVEKDSLYLLEAQNFNLANFSEFLVGDNLQIGGRIDIESTILHQDTIPRLDAKITISDLLLNQTRIGDIRATIHNTKMDVASVELVLENEMNKIQVNGEYNPGDQKSPLQLDLNLDITSLADFETFANGTVTKMEGKISGDAKIEGKLEDITVNGELFLEQVGFFYKQLNNEYWIEKESIVFNKNQLQLNDFTVSDSLDNNFTVDGHMDFFQDGGINFNLHILADQFTVYNVPEKDNATLYGQMIISADAQATGSLASPKVNLSLSIENSTDMTYVLPPKEINLVSYEEFVEFEIPNDFDTSLIIVEKRNLTDTLFARFEGIDLQAKLIIDENARYKLIIDPSSGDYVSVNGRGDLNIRFQEGSDPLLSGVYNITDGEYRVSFYGLVQKSFTIHPGSTITWTGNPDNARINLSTSHVLRTSSSGLVAAETVGLSDEEMRQYRKALPYEVKIFIKGTFQNPELTFAIDLIDEDKAAFPLVISKLNRINSKGYESQLTQQVFGLLTIGSFIPEQTADTGTGYGAALATTAAANSLNGILTRELNKLSGKYLQGIDIDIGMQTSSQMSSGSSSTQTTMDVKFSKNFYDDRITIEAQTSFDVGGDNYLNPTGNNYSNFQSDFAIKYDLNQRGEYKLKVFNKSSYDIIYKDIRTTGFAIIFVKEFDKLSDIKKERKDQRNR